MIYIEERESKSVPGDNSFFISFQYRVEIVDVLKTIPCCVYDKKSKEWETTITNLSVVLDRLCLYDSIKLTILGDIQEKEDEIFTLSPHKTTPFPYQEEGIIYGLNHNNFLLLDPPGLGKTLQLIYLAEELHERGLVSHCLVVCGINVLKTNWKKEIERHSGLSCKILGERGLKNGKRKVKGIKERVEDLQSEIEEFFIITNIETLRNKEVLKLIKSGVNKIDMAAVDEIHCCKNPNSLQGANLLKLDTMPYKVGMTGTLLLNSPFDAYVPLQFIGANHSSFTNFKRQFGVFDGFTSKLIGYKNIDFLKDIIEKHSIRRSKDLLNLPPKNIIQEYVELEEDQRKFYEDIKHGVKEDVDKVPLNTTSVLSLISRLRQAIACPSILTSSEISSAKINRALDLISQITENGEKVIVYSTFKETLYALGKQLEEGTFTVCTGDLSDDAVSENSDLFKTSDKCNIMLATWQKLGTGLTFTESKYIIFLDCAWTSSRNEQAEDRIYRIGSGSPVFIYYLWAVDTIDEKLKLIVETKKAISDYIVDGEVDEEVVNLLKNIILDL